MITGIPYIAEFLGTFLLVLAMTASGGNAILVGVVYAAIIFLAGQLSGAYVNPAVSIAMFMKGAITTAELIGYCVAEVLGAVIALYTYMYVR